MFQTIYWYSLFYLVKWLVALPTLRAPWDANIRFISTIPCSHMRSTKQPSYLLFFKHMSLRRNLTLIIFNWQHLGISRFSWKKERGEGMKRKLFSLSTKVVIVYYEEKKLRVKIIRLCTSLSHKPFPQKRGRWLKW